MSAAETGPRSWRRWPGAGDVGAKIVEDHIDAAHLSDNADRRNAGSAWDPIRTWLEMGQHELVGA